MLTDAKTLELGEVQFHQTSSRASGTVPACSRNSCCPILSATLCQERFICTVSFNPRHHPRSCSRRKLRFKRLATPKGTQGATQCSGRILIPVQPSPWASKALLCKQDAHLRQEGLGGLEERVGVGGGALGGSWMTTAISRAPEF